MTSDAAEQLNSVKWNVYGKIVEINRTPTGSVNVNKIKYYYDPLGNRIGKSFDIGGQARHTWYVRDAQGNILSTYYAEGTPNDSLASFNLDQQEVYLYGSSRLGMRSIGNNVDHSNAGPPSMQYYSGGTFQRGWKQYELTNHLGNVLVTISDRKIGVSSGGSLYSYYNPHIVSGNDYFPFGMMARVALATTGKYYKFGFNGKEFDWEAKGWQNQVDYGMRIYDPRIGRFLSVDPLSNVYPHYSSYQFAGNKPIWAIDIDGLEEQKKTSVTIPKINLKNLFDSDDIRQQLSDKIYQQLGHVMTNAEMDQKPGERKSRNDIVLSVIGEYLIVDVNDGYATLLDPDSHEPSVFFKISKGLLNYAVDETKPGLIQLTGILLYEAGKMLEKVSQEVENYRNKFYKKYFPDKFNDAVKANKKTISTASKATKGVGKLAKIGGKGLNFLGTVQLWYSILNPSPGSLSDDEIRESVIKELKRFIKKSNEEIKETKSESTMSNNKLN